MAEDLNEKLSLANRVFMAVATRIPYGIGTRVLAGIYRNSLLRRLLFKRRMRFLRGLMHLGTADPQEAQLRHLTCNLFMPWRVVALSRLSNSEVSNWVRFENEDILRQHYNKEHGIVIINSHIGAGRAFSIMMLRRGYVVTTMEPEPYLLRMGAKDADKLPIISLRGGNKFWLKEIFRARKVLQTGEILHLAADGQAGKGGIMHSFHDIDRLFYVSFADLALQTNATVIPTFVNIGSDGKLVIEFLPALDSGSDSLTKEERTNLLLDQYVACLEQKWRENPGNVLTPHLRLYNRKKAEQNASASAQKSTE